MSEAPATVQHTSSAAELSAALTDLAAHDSILVCLDFDGCVAELVADAASARPVPENARAIDQLSTLAGVTVAYVSGRPLADLHALASPPAGTILVGSHGAEVDMGDDAPGLQLDAGQEAARRTVLETLTSVAADHEGAWVEHKPAGGAIHVRKVTDPETGEHILDEARAALAMIDGAHVKEGKQIVEAVVVHATKGEAITELRERIAPGAVFFAGDDVTDEYGFAVLTGQDVGVKVGEGETAAGLRIAAPADLAGVLDTLTQLRRRPGSPETAPTEGGSA
jgi:trehalose 6-phosphate phosphatase